MKIAGIGHSRSRLLAEATSHQIQSDTDSYLRMGNNCVASGGTPHRADISLHNNTSIQLFLDTEVACGRECGHRGWVVTDGKIVEGRQPPEIIQPYSSARFSVSGRENTAVAPKGRVFYTNQAENLNVEFVWISSGWTSWSSSHAAVAITGIPPSTGAWLSSTPVPWDRQLLGEFNGDTWNYNLRPVEGTLAEARRTAKKLENPKVCM